MTQQTNLSYRPDGPREAILLEASNLLMDARRTMTPIDALSENLLPQSMEESYWIQDQIAEAFEPIGGWKVGAPGADAHPLYAPMPLAGIHAGGACLRSSLSRYRGLEAEVAFLLGEDLPRRTTPYTREEVLAALQSCHPAIEVLESAFVDPEAVDNLSRVADLQMHGGFVFGPACPDWQQVDLSQERVSLDIDGTVREERTGSNPAGDLLRLLPWLANEGAARTGGLRRGQWITTGSWTGNTLAIAGSSVDVRFSSLGRVTVGFE